MNKNERNILLVTCYGHFLSHFNMLVFPAVLLPLTRQFGMELSQTLALSFWMYLLFGVTALPWGLIADKVGTKTMLTLFYAGAGMSGFAAALGSGDPLLFSLALTALGLFTGIYHPVGLGWIAREIDNTSIGMAYNGIFGNLGLAVAPLFAGLINYYGGVSAVYFLVGLVNLSGLIPLLRTRTRASRTSAPRPAMRSGGNLVPFLILLLAMMLGGIVYRGTSVTLPAYFELHNARFFDLLEGLLGGIGSENVAATAITSFIYFVGMAGQYAGGKVGEKYDLRTGYLLFHLITIPAAVAMAMTSDIPLIAFALVHSFFLLGMQPIENTLVSRLTPPSLMSSAFGLKFILTFGVGALGVKVIEMVKSGYGTSAIFLALAAVSSLLVATILVLILKTSRSQVELKAPSG